MPDAATRVRVSEAYGKIPLHFEANQGQTDAQVKFLARGPGSVLLLTPTEAVLVLTRPEPREQRAGHTRTGKPGAREKVTRTALRMAFVGANPKPEVGGREELPGQAHYFIGKDPAKWRTKVPTYARVHYQDLYPGIDLLYYGNPRQLEYDFVVRPGADPRRIALSFRGADNLEVDAQGDLVLHTAAGAIRQRKPFIYQEIASARREVSGAYVLTGPHQVGFHIAAYDPSRPLVIDPTLVYSTYLGGTLFDAGNGIAIDAHGNAYVAGDTSSLDFPTTGGALDTTFNGRSDAFVTKLDAAGSALVYSTFLGGTLEESALGIAVDAHGCAYVTGVTFSPDFPITPGAFDTALGGLEDAFVTKLDAAGSALVYSTYLGGTLRDVGRGIAVDAHGNAYVTGETFSLDFPPTSGAFDTALGGLEDAFVTKLDAAGSALVYSTYLGGTLNDAGLGGIAVDAAGHAYVTGTTLSLDFPTTGGAFDTSLNGVQDAFVTKLHADGCTLVYSTYLGGTLEDFGAGGIAIDAAGHAYVTGQTFSLDFPTTAGAFDTTFNGALDNFVTKLHADGSALVYSTYLGGTLLEGGSRIAVDAHGHAYVTGETSSLDFPTTGGAFDASPNGLPDAFVTKLHADGSALVYSTYLGGTLLDFGAGIAIDAAGHAYVTGGTLSTDFPTTGGAFNTMSNGTFDAFVTKLADTVDPPHPPVHPHIQIRGFPRVQIPRLALPPLPRL